MAQPLNNMPAAIPTNPPANNSEIALSSTNLYIRGLPQNYKDADLREMCKDLGNITSTKAILDPTTNQCKGYGFVDFANAADASHALAILKEKSYQVQMAKLQEPDTTNLYIDNLPPTMKEEELKTLFQESGTVVSTRILTKPDQSSKCQGFARMQSKQQCEAAIEKFNGRVMAGQLSAGGLLVKFADQSNRKKSQASRQNQTTPVIAYPAMTVPSMPPMQFTSVDATSHTGLNYIPLSAPPQMMPATQPLGFASSSFATTWQGRTLLWPGMNQGIAGVPTTTNDAHAIQYYHTAATLPTNNQQQLQHPHLFTAHQQHSQQQQFVQAAAPSQLNEVPYLNNVPGTAGSVPTVHYNPAQFAYQNGYLHHLPN